MNTQIKSYQIIIFGCGIVGMSLALKLEQLGFKVALVAKNPLNPKISEQKINSLALKLNNDNLKVSALSAHSLQLLKTIGLAEVIDKFAHFYHKIQVVDYYSNNSFDFDSQFLKDYPLSDHQALGAIMANSILAKSLSQLVLKKAIDCYTNNQKDENQLLEISADKTILNLGSQIIEADLLVAADGVNSTMRQLSGLGLKQKDYGQKALVAYLRVEKPIKGLAWQCFKAEKTIAFLPCFESFIPKGNKSKKNGYHYSLVWVIDENQYQNYANFSADKLIETINTMVQTPFGKIESLSQWTYFPLLKKQACQYAGQGIFLIGDAAHSIHPLAGMGLNLGLIDVALLAKHLTKLRAKNLTFNEFKNLYALAEQRYLDNQFAQRLMEGFALFYQLKIPHYLPIFNQINFDHLPKWLKKSILKYASGFR